MVHLCLGTVRDPVGSLPCMRCSGKAVAVPTYWLQKEGKPRVGYNIRCPDETCEEFQWMDWDWAKRGHVVFEPVGSVIDVAVRSGGSR